MASFKDILQRRKDELDSLGEGKPGEKGSTRTKEEAVRRARGSDTVKDVNGKAYDRMKRFREDTKGR